MIKKNKRKWQEEKLPIIMSTGIIRNHTVCKKCNITLCEKNEMLYERSYKGVKYSLNMGQCKACHSKTSFCKYKYEDPILNEYSLIEYKRVAKKLHHFRNAETYKARSREFARNAILNISDDYSRLCLLSHPYLDLKRSDITPEMIELHRKQLIVKRKLKKQGIWVR
jgi:hypothetical protein